MNIAYVVHSLNLGGAERLAADMATAFAREHEISIVCLDEPGLWAQSVRDNNIPVSCLYRQPGLDPRIPWLLACFAKKHRIQIWHAHQCTPWFYTGLSRMIYRRPRLLFEEHGRHYPEVKSRKRSLVNRLLLQPLTHSMTAVSADIKQRLIDYEGLSRDRIHVVHNGGSVSQPLDPEERDRGRGELGLNNGDLLLGTVGRFDPIKNLPMVIRAFAQSVEHRNNGLKLLLVGDGPEFESLRNLTHQMGLDGKVIMPGYQPDPERWTALMDCFLLGSFSEGISMALLGSMAAAIPAIVTDVGGNPDIVQDGRTGWVVPSDDADAFTRVLNEVAANPAERHKRGQAARELFMSRFTFQTMLDRYREMYDSLFVDSLIR